MTFRQTTYFKEDVNHYTAIAREWMYTTRKEEVRQSIQRLEHIRGKEYVKALSGKCNQILKVKFY